MYPYHNINIKRIKNGELIRVENSQDLRYAFLLVFTTQPTVRPIRHCSAHRYQELLEKYLPK